MYAISLNIDISHFLYNDENQVENDRPYIDIEEEIAAFELGDLRLSTEIVRISIQNMTQNFN